MPRFARQRGAGQREPRQSGLVGNFFYIYPDVCDVIVKSKDPFVIQSSLSLSVTSVKFIGNKIDPEVLQTSTLVTVSNISVLSKTINPVIYLGSSSTPPESIPNLIGNNIDPNINISGLTVTLDATSASSFIGKIKSPRVAGEVTLISPSSRRIILSTIEADVHLGSVVLCPANRKFTGSTNDPITLLGNTISIPSSLNVLLKTKDPSDIIYGSINIIPSSIPNTVGNNISPVIELSSTIAIPSIASKIISNIIDPSVIKSGVLIYANTDNVVVKSIDPNILLGSSSTPPESIPNLIGNSIDPSIILGSISISPSNKPNILGDLPTIADINVFDIFVNIAIADKVNTILKSLNGQILQNAEIIDLVNNASSFKTTSIFDMNLARIFDANIPRDIQIASQEFDFYTEREKSLLESLSQELMENWVKNYIYYLKIDIIKTPQTSKEEILYGESDQKVTYKPLKLYALIMPEYEPNMSGRGYNVIRRLEVRLLNSCLREVDLKIEAGDFIVWNDRLYEILNDEELPYYASRSDSMWAIRLHCEAVRKNILDINLSDLESQETGVSNVQYIE